MALAGNFDAIASTASYCSDNYSTTSVIFAFRKSTQSGANFYKIVRDNVDLTNYLISSNFPEHDDSSVILYYIDNTCTNLSGHAYQVRTAEDSSGTNESALSASITLNILPSLTSLYTSAGGIGINPFAYQTTGGIGIFRLRQEREDVLGGQEVYQSSRKTKWFAIGDYEQDAKIRRVKLSYKSNKPFKVKLYADHSTIPTHTLVFEQAVLKKMRHKKATLRAKLLQVEIETDKNASQYLEIYGIEIETDG